MITGYPSSFTSQSFFSVNILQENEIQEVKKVTNQGLHNSKFVGIPAVCKMLTGSLTECIYNKFAQLGSLEM